MNVNNGAQSCFTSSHSLSAQFQQPCNCAAAFDSVVSEVQRNYSGYPSSQDTLMAVVLKADSVCWTPGQVKALFTAADSGLYATRYYLRDHSEQSYRARLTKNLLRVSLHQ